MTRDETKQLLVLIQTAFPSYKPQDKTLAVDLWHAMLADYEYGAILAALQAFITTNTSGFAPTIGQLLDQYHRLIQKPRLETMAAWSMVSKAIRNGIYGYKEEFERLPVEVQRAVGSAEQLHYWAMSEDYNEDVAMSNFRKSYEVVCKRQDEFERPPMSARNLIEQTANRLEG
ncbi:MAG: hypothetical protein LIP02_13800 [Bacteroidales bacterium]|nr:hypothetical protein [Bacteroidales bacterium]MCC8177374.1 hypothetical protein [Bacteroidales bacterium]